MTLKKSLRFALAAAVLFSLSSATTASAGPITSDAGWYGFCFANGPGNPATAGCQNSGIGTEGNQFSFVLADAGFVNVTDAFIFGDTFDVYIDTVLVGTTGGGSHATATTGDPDIAFASGGYDTGSFAVAAGAHTIDILTNVTAGGAGGAYVQVVSGAVPEPASLALLAMGLAGGLARRFRRS